MSHKTRCRDCNAPITLVLLIPGRLVKGRARRFIPLDPTFDPDPGVRPSHAVSPGWTTCRPVTAASPVTPSEHPALTHFATCPNRAAPARTDPASTATEGRP